MKVLPLMFFFLLPEMSVRFFDFELYTRAKEAAHTDENGDNDFWRLEIMQSSEWVVLKYNSNAFCKVKTDDL